MLKLVTGLPGAGKTSNELWDFLNNREYAGREKFCTPIKGFNAAEHGVTQLEHIDKWQELPEGSVILCDEVQRYCGTDIGREAPQWVQDFAIHRHSGKDFIFITQAPGFLHPFARKLVQPHVNYHRPYNLGRVMRYSWESVQNDPASNTARNLGQSSMVKTNAEVFKLYTSTVLDTHKARPPIKTLAILAAAILIAVVAFFYVFKYVKHFTSDPEIQQTPAAQQAVIRAAADPVSIPVNTGENKPVWTEANMKPRQPGLLYSAPIFDGLTAPTDFPRVSACMSSESRGTCNCYTQQGTPIDVPQSACLVYIKHGSFDYWLSGRKQQGQQSSPVPEEPRRTDPVIATAPRPEKPAYTVVADTSRLFARTKDARQ